jgi:amino acid transporter
MSSNRTSGFGLCRDCLSFPEVLAQSIAVISPSSPTVLVALVFASAGNGTWLAYLLATIGLLLVGLQINQFGKRSASPGAFFVYIGQALGPTVSSASVFADDQRLARASGFIQLPSASANGHQVCHRYSNAAIAVTELVR